MPPRSGRVAWWPWNRSWKMALAMIALVGLPALTLHNQLGIAAELHAQDQAAGNFSSHTGSDGSSIEDRIRRSGSAFSWFAENISFGGGTATEAINWWTGSTDHNANTLSTNFAQIGIARAEQRGRLVLDDDLRPPGLARRPTSLERSPGATYPDHQWREQADVGGAAS